MTSTWTTFKTSIQPNKTKQSERPRKGEGYKSFLITRLTCVRFMIQLILTRVCHPFIVLWCLIMFRYVSLGVRVVIYDTNKIDTTHTTQIPGSSGVNNKIRLFFFCHLKKCCGYCMYLHWFSMSGDEYLKIFISIVVIKLAL